MKKLIILLISFVSISFLTTQSFAKSDAYKDKQIVAFGGLGFGLYRSYGDMVVPPIWVGADYNYQKEPKVPLSFGGVLGYAKSEEKISVFNYTWKFTYSYLLIGGRAAYHFTPFIDVKNLDLYAGIILGYAIVSSEVSEPAGVTGFSAEAEGSYFLWGIFGGARYYFSEKLGGFAEVGFGLANFAVGVCYRM